MEPQALVARVQAHLGDGALERVEFRGEVTVVVPADRVREALEAVRAAPGGPWMLTDLTAVDRHPTEPRFEVVYLLTGLQPPVRLRVKARLPADRPVIGSVTGLWPGADWLEREVYDLFGIRFEGHPNLSRILLPDDWEGHPLRKDFPLTEEPVEFIGHVPNVPSQIIPTSPPRR
ncbi:MAG: NADH-quinone oxidoreductase subunit C [Armatimonadota bacterium]|nr:NADH-quinone oxidoreductase subunit C [Armatimonadota bacterium]MDR7533180.1 NADH-quinone oxidoreductase subunit C [Armatimonadota bacterium]MDR7535432.1 NADH-quinone oxidoreductase subunit C [Armatimonadota bacterium]